MAIRIGRRVWFYGLLIVVAILILPERCGAEPQVIEAAVRVLPAKQPALYLRFRNNRLWMASSKAGLEKATPIRAAKVDTNQDNDAGIEYRSYEFPEVNLPRSPGGAQNVRAAFYSSRTIGKGNAAPANVPEDRTSIAAFFTISRRDKSGVVWSYQLHSMAGSDTTKSAKQHLELVLPPLDPDRLSLGVVVKVEGLEAKVGLQVKCGDLDLDNVLKDKKNAPAAIQIVNRDGEEVVSAKGDLQKFGFT
jgi:hypothetical protein